MPNRKTGVRLANLSGGSNLDPPINQNATRLITAGLTLITDLIVWPDRLASSLDPALSE